uniref:Uncharacterized protein n=1 Tax=Glossina pallidipes TaxID=7398 RepID=A0A1A9ZD30_GLOPL
MGPIIFINRYFSAHRAGGNRYLEITLNDFYDNIKDQSLKCRELLTLMEMLLQQFRAVNTVVGIRSAGPVLIQFAESFPSVYLPFAFPRVPFQIEDNY